MATKAPIYKVIPTIELQASEVDYSNQLDSALFLAKFDHQEVCLVSNDGRQIFCNRSLLSIFSKSIRNILDSSVVHQIPDTTPIIIVPDCSGDSISKVHDILLNGSTRCSISSFNDINNVVETAKTLGIEMKDLGFVPFSSLEKRRPIEQPIPKPSVVTVEPSIDFKVTIPQSENVSYKKESVDDISIVGFAGDPNKAIPLNIKVEQSTEKEVAEVEKGKVASTLSNDRVIFKLKKKKKKHLKIPVVDQIKTKNSDLQKVPHSDANLSKTSEKSRTGTVQKFRPSSVPTSSKKKTTSSTNKSHISRPESVDDFRPLSAKSVEVNKVHHARLAEISDDELAFTFNQNYFTPPYTKTLITNEIQGEEESMTVVSPDFFDEPEPIKEGKPDECEIRNTDELFSADNEKVKVDEFMSQDSENSYDVSNLSESFYESDVEMNASVEEQVPVSFVEEEIPVACEEAFSSATLDECEVGPMKPLAEEESDIAENEEFPTKHANENENSCNEEKSQTQDIDIVPIKAVTNVESSGKEAFYGFADVQTTDQETLNTEINPCEFGEESNDSVSRVLEIEDIELEIKKLEKELDNTLDNDECVEEPSTKVPRTYEFQELPEDQKSYKEKDFLSDEENEEDFYVEATKLKTDTISSVENLLGMDHEDQQNFDSKSLLVDNYINTVIEKNMDEVEKKENTKEDEWSIQEDIEEVENTDQSLNESTSKTSVTEELEKIFGEGVEDFDEKMKSSSLSSVPEPSATDNQVPTESSPSFQIPTKPDEQSIIDNLFENNPSDKIASLIGNNSISIGRINDQTRKRIPDYKSDYNSLRIERVKSKDRKPKIEKIEQLENQPIKIERVGSSERSKSRPKHESWMTEKRSSRSSGKYSPQSNEQSKEMEHTLKEEIHVNELKSREDLDQIRDEIMNDIVKETDSAPKRERSQSPSLGSHLVNSLELEMSMAKRSKKVETQGDFKASNLDHQINKLRQTYAAPRSENESLDNFDNQQMRTSDPDTVKKNLSSMTFPQLSRAGSSAPNAHAPPSLEMQLLNHACVVCQKSDFGGQVNARYSKVKEHYCHHFRAEILDLYKNEIKGNTCIIDGCGKTIMDTKETKPSLARHIGAAHSKIYKILKLRGHKVEFLKPRDEKRTRTRSKEIKPAEVKPVARRVKAKDIVSAANEKKIPLKTTEKVECNFCTRKYSNNFNLRKHILSAHDKLLD
eukprot:GFUD01019600.1.p1 GENE.GFUD01019600.1~~GFUD01019600.1.p1  ORF type:complete len:1223 (-),score=333.86 GFUD01019600.1:265-3882(-)